MYVHVFITAARAGLAATLSLQRSDAGPLLEEQGKKIGVVRAIAAPASATIKFEGHGGHAGGQLMHLRNDASLAAAELALALEEKVLSFGVKDAVGTTGRWLVQPNAVNSVPRVAELQLDMRDTDEGRRDEVLQFVLQKATLIGAARKVNVSSDIVSQDPPAKCAAQVQAAVQRAADAVVSPGKTIELVSRAYHDSLFMARIASTGMIFIPCANGWSHRPDEYASGEDMADGIRVLALTMAELAESPSEDDLQSASRNEL